MDFRKKVFVSVLLIMSSNLAENSVESATPATCDEIQAAKFTSNLREIKSFPKKLMVVMTDSVTRMYNQLEDVLKEIKHVVISSQREEDKDKIKHNFEAEQFLKHAVNISVVIYVDNIWDILAMYDYIVTTFGDLSYLKNSIALLVRNAGKYDDVKAELRAAINKYPRNQTKTNLAEFLLSGYGHIGIVGKTYKRSEEDVSNLIRSLEYADKGNIKFEFPIDYQFQKVIECAFRYENKKVHNSIKQFVAKLNNIIWHQYETKVKTSEEITDALNYLRNSLLEFNDSINFESFMHKLDEVIAKFQVPSWKKKSYLHQNKQKIQFLFDKSIYPQEFSIQVKTWFYIINPFKLEMPALNITCDETQADIFTSDLREMKVFPINLMVIVTDYVTGMHNQFENELKKINHTIVMEPEILTGDIKYVFETEQILKHALYINIVIYTEKTNSILKIFKYIATTLGDVSYLQESIALIVKDDDSNGESSKVEEILKNITSSYPENPKMANLAKLLLAKPEKIGIIDKNDKSTIKVNGIIDQLAYSDNHKTKIKPEFLFDIEAKYMIDCALSRENEKIVNNMTQFVGMLNDTLRQNESNVEISKRIADALNYLLNSSRELIEAENLGSFIYKLDEIIDKFEVQLGDKKEITTYFHENDQRIQFLLAHASDKDAFFKAVIDWIHPLRNLKLEKTEKGNIFSPMLTKKCRKMKYGEKLEIRGYVVKLSDANSHNCSNLTFVEIFALDEVFINTDFIQVGKALQVAIIAPVWTVIGKRVINLNGEDGQALEEEKAITVGRSGKDGLAGLPGEPAGSFYGVANRIINAKDLSIFANGGDGGKGQNGGDGVDGEPGIRYETGEVTNEWRYSDRGSKRFGLGKGEEMNYTVYGTEGKTGGRSGNGGIGGIGGKAGNIMVYELRNNSTEFPVTKSTRNGKEGIGGNGGRPGLGGKNGETVDVTHIIYYSQHGASKRWIITRIYSETYPGNGIDGLSGKQGTSRRKHKLPKKAIIVQNFPNTVTQFKLWARLHLSGSELEKKDMLSQLYDSLDNHEGILKNYDISILVAEFTELELQYFSLKKQIDLTSSYENLKLKIAKYKTFATGKGDLNEDDERILTNLHRKIQSKLVDAKFSPTQHRIVKNFKDDYMLLRYIDIEELEKRNEDYRITKWLDQHKEPLDELIDDAQYMLNEVIPTVMDDLESDLDQEIEALLEEITDLYHASEDKKTELASQREKLQSALIYKVQFKVFEGACTAIGGFHPALGAATTVISTIASYAEDEQTGEEAKVETVGVPKYVQDKLNNKSKYLQNQAEKQKRTLEDQKTYVDEYLGSVSGRTREQIELVWDSTKKVRESSEISVNNKLKRMEEIYATKEQQLQNLISEKSGTGESTSEYIMALYLAQHLKNSSHMSYTVGEVYKRFENNTDKMNEINIALHETQRNLNALQEFEDEIENKTQPMLQDLMQGINNFDDLTRNGTKLNKWLKEMNQRRSLQNVSHILEKMTKDLDAGNELIWTFRNIEDTLKMIIALTDKIEEYSLDKLNQNFIAGLHLVRNEYLLIPDSHLRNLLIRLDQVSIYNVVSDQYDDWLFAFKQYSFPNAGDILIKLRPLDATHKKMNIKYMIANIISNIKEMETSMKTPPDTFTTHERYKTNEYFVGRSSSGKAFYTWTSDRYSQQIGEVLEGEKVKFVANVYDEGNLNALKFNKVEIRFVSRNPELQAELDNILIHFKVFLTHMGDSKYRCKEQVFEIQNLPTILHFGFQLHKNGLPSSTSVFYDTLSDGGFMLSPYATWSIFLKTKLPEKQPLLANFKGKVDLELVGKGQYLDELFLQCGNDMEQYYTKVN